jgi:ATP-dependent protease HslVU (ClpYQ) peptidase subunit
MSVLVGYKKDGVVYMGSDTQVTYGSYSRHHEHEKDQKLFISKELSLIVGTVGTASHAYVLRELLPSLTSLKNGALSKERLQKELVLPYMNALKSYELMEMSNGLHDMKISILIAKEDMLFQIEEDGNILNHVSYGSIGSGSPATLSYLKHSKKSPEEIILTSLRTASTFDQYVSHPYLMTNTHSLILEEVKE